MAKRPGVNDGLAVVGLEQIQSKLTRVSDNVRKKYLRRALYAGAVVIRDEARREVPVRYGALKKQIVAKSSAPDPRAKEVVASVGVARGKFRVSSKVVKKKLAGGLIESKTKYSLKRIEKGKGDDVVSPRRYAHLVELGTKRTRAKPFLRPAAEGKKAEVVRAASDSIAKSVKKDAESP